MLFKVRWKVNNKIYPVYHIDKFLLDDDYNFFVYDKEKGKWNLIPANECIPVEE